MTERTQGESGTTFRASAVCEQCLHKLRGGAFPLDCFCGAQEALAELVEVKRLQESSGDTPYYRRRWAMAWAAAFKVCGIVEAQKL